MKPIIGLADVYKYEPRLGYAAEVLYRLLAERTPEQSISHRKMPTREEHLAFMESRPYEAWYIVLAYENEDGPARGVPTTVGSVYLSKQREIGIFIFKDCQGKGYGTAAVKMLMDKHPGTFYSHVNPANTVSAAMFKSLGFELLQHTYRKE